MTFVPLLVGNGPYRNRGCEAIVRGTMEILASTFGKDLNARAGVMASPNTVTAQQASELDCRVKNFPVSHVGLRFSPKWWLAQSNARLGTHLPAHTRDLRKASKDVTCALQLGGDNYSLDYGRPWDYISIDQWLVKHRVPVVLWGASVGPFDTDPSFAHLIHEHLKSLAGIFVRETASRDYLAKHGITANVHLVADPAFCMAEVPPPAPLIDALVMEGMIGINISPLVARFSQVSGNLPAWREQAADMIVAVADRLGKPLLLVPHVQAPSPAEDDFTFMAELGAMVRPRITVPLKVVPDGLGAAQLKWLIARCTVFAGARTHATIAALSSGVPTLSLSYSIKAVGINQDIFGHQHFCRSVKSISAGEFAKAIDEMLCNADQVRCYLTHKLPDIKARARAAGPLLATILAEVHR